MIDNPKARVLSECREAHISVARGYRSVSSSAANSATVIIITGGSADDGTGGNTAAFVAERMKSEFRLERGVQLMKKQNNVFCQAYGNVHGAQVRVLDQRRN